MKLSTIVWVIIGVAIILGAWYWWATQSNSAGGPSTAMGLNGSPNQGNFGNAGTSSPQGDGTPVGENLILGINAATGTLPTFLSAYNGMTVYTYSKDTPGVSNCTGTCAINWPPYTVPSAADINVPASISGTVSTITRDDGTLQVTYNGLPLYFYIKDKNPGDTTGQGVGGVWYVAQP